MASHTRLEEIQTKIVEDAAPNAQRFFPYIALTFGLLTLGMSGIFVKWANAPGAVSGFYRMIIAATVLVIPFGVQTRRRVEPLSMRHVLFAVLGGVFFACDVTSWNTALLLTSAANATLFGNTSPLWVGIGALVLFKEKLRPAFWGGMLLAMFGAVIILSQDLAIHTSLGAGDLLGFASGFFYGLFFLAAERARDRLPSLAALWISVASSTLVLFGLSLLLHQPFLGYPTATYLNLIALALIVQVAGWFAINYALGHLPASLVSPTLLGQPVLTAILAVPLLGQPLGWAQIVGGLVVLAGILIVHRSV